MRQVFVTSNQEMETLNRQVVIDSLLFIVTKNYFNLLIELRKDLYLFESIRINFSLGSLTAYDLKSVRNAKNLQLLLSSLMSAKYYNFKDFF